MKKFIILMMSIVACLTVATSTEAQNKALNKALKKEYKTKMKEYTKGGWELFGSSRSLDVMLLKHYEKLGASDDVKEVYGVASRAVSKSVGHQVAINDACRTYAQSAGSHVKGRIVSDLGADGHNTVNEFEHFYAAYERNVEKEIKGELTESFTIFRKIGKDDNGSAVYEMMTFFIVDESAASLARIRAFENAAKESAAAQKYAENVSKFIKEGFEVER